MFYIFVLLTSLFFSCNAQATRLISLPLLNTIQDDEGQDTWPAFSGTPISNPHQDTSETLAQVAKALTKVVTKDLTDRPLCLKTAAKKILPRSRTWPNLKRLAAKPATLIIEIEEIQSTESEQLIPNAASRVIMPLASSYTWPALPSPMARQQQDSLFSEPELAVPTEKTAATSTQEIIDPNVLIKNAYWHLCALQALTKLTKPALTLSY